MMTRWVVGIPLQVYVRPSYIGYYHPMFILHMILLQSGQMRKLAVLATFAALLVAVPPAPPECAALPAAPPGAGGRAGDSSGPAVFLNELLPAPGTAFAREWIELFNAGSTSVDLGGWALDDVAGGGSGPYVIPGGTVIAASGFLVLNDSTTRLGLNNDGDTVRLLGPSGDELDNWSFGHCRYDASFGRFPDGSARWRIFDSPTPGASNGAPVPPGPADRSVLVTQVYYHAFPGKGDEFVAVTNPDPGSSVDLSGWGIASGESAVAFPAGSLLDPGATVYITGNASDFLPDAGFLPDFETRGSRADVGQARATGNWPILGNEGGAVELHDANGETIDVFAWGRPFNGTGWTGPPAALLDGGGVARRLKDPSGSWLDTNSSPDWPAPNGAVVGQSDFPAATFDSGRVTTFVSPDCSFGAIAGELDRARFSILLAVYQFESWPLALRLVAARERNVAIGVLMEGAPVEGISDQERAVARLLAESGATVSYLASRPGPGVPDRYSFLHAKYCVIDDSTCIVSSENWKASAIPSDNTFGNRGWGVAVESPGLARYLSAVFLSDSNPAMRDVNPYSPGGGPFGPPPPEFVPDTSVPKGSFRPRSSAAVFGPGVLVRPVLAPDTSRLENGSILGLIRSATRTLYVEQMSCPPDWDHGGSKLASAYLDAVVGAARRGVRVRVLLDGTYLDSAGEEEDNGETVNLLNHVAASERLDLQARISKIPGALKLHNKGVVADGRRVLVSSINWGHNSVFENREVGLVLDGAGVAGYFESVFERDWNQSAPGPGPNGSRTGGGWGGLQPDAARALALSAVLVAAAVVIVLRRAGSRRRRY